MKLCDSSINGFYEAMKKTLSMELRLLSLTLLAVWMGLGVSAKPNEKEPLKPTTVLYDRVLNRDNPDPELIFEDRTAEYTDSGLSVTGKEGLVRLDRYYSLGERAVRYHVKLSADARAVFQGDQGEFKAYVDMAARTISIGVTPEKIERASLLNPEHEYIVEVRREYQTSTLHITDLYTGESEQIEVTVDGSGGCGAGAVKSEVYVGRQYDYYCFGLVSGTELLVKQICVVAPKCDLTLLLYGDSITEPDGYFPSELFPQSWVQQIIRRVRGGAIASGRGGTTINEVLKRIVNELPYLKAKYVMVTIGTNGGNTEENLSQLVEYILSQGAIPILNNIPCNESASQIAENALIERVRQKYGIKGCKFDLATSKNYDGKEVDPSSMWLEDYGPNSPYVLSTYMHHPNVSGADRMVARTLIDVPEIYE